MKKYFILIPVMILIISPDVFSQASQKEKDAFINFYSASYNSDELSNLFSDPTKSAACKECAESIMKSESLKDIKDEFNGFGLELGRLYRVLGIVISDDYSRKIMPGFNIKDYDLNASSQNVFADSDPHNFGFSIFPYNIIDSNYTALVTAYSNDRRNNFTPGNAYSSMIFQFPELLEKLKKEIKSLNSNTQSLTDNQLTDMLEFWLEKAHYNKLSEDALKMINEDISIEQERIKVCNEIVRKVIDKSNDNLNSVTVVKEDNGLETTNNKDIQTKDNTNDNSKKNDEMSSGWAGTWVQDGNIATVTISGSAAFYTATFEYQVSDSKGTGGSWDNCKVNGNTMTGTWSINHTDDTKSGKRSGTFSVTLGDGVISGSYTETDDPDWKYKPGFTKENVNSVMKKGATFSIHMTKK